MVALAEDDALQMEQREREYVELLQSSRRTPKVPPDDDMYTEEQLASERSRGGISSRIDLPESRLLARKDSTVGSRPRLLGLLSTSIRGLCVSRTVSFGNQAIGAEKVANLCRETAEIPPVRLLLRDSIRASGRRQDSGGFSPDHTGQHLSAHSRVFSNGQATHPRGISGRY